MKEETEVTIAKMQKDIEYIREGIGGMTKKIDRIEQGAGKFIVRDEYATFVKERFEPLDARVSEINNQLLKLVTTISVLGGVGMFLINQALSRFF